MNGKEGMVIINLTLKKMKGYKDPEPPDVSSSLGEFFKKQNEIK